MNNQHEPLSAAERKNQRVAQFCDTVNQAINAAITTYEQDEPEETISASWSFRIKERKQPKRKPVAPNGGLFGKETHHG